MLKFDHKEGYRVNRVKTCHILILILMLQSHHALHGAKGDETENVGNFLLPTSQQPGPLYAFGQNIVDQHDFQIFINLFQIGGKSRNLSQFFPSILYGIRDDFSLFIAVPFTAASKDGNNHAAGLNDMSIQLEYAFINKKVLTSITQATIVGNIGIPSGSGKKVPHTGYGALSFFLGFTFSYSTAYWYVWIDAGTTLTTPRNKTKFGNQFLYQGGIEYCFATRPGWIFAAEVELFGLYEQKDKINGTKDNNSGGNTFWIGPSLWASSEKLIFEIGIAAPIAQHLNGTQTKNNYFLETNFGYKFN